MVDPVIIGNAQLYLGDCREILPHLPKVDACITDPPYGIDYAHSGGGGIFAKDGTRKSTKFGGEKIAGDAEPFNPEPFLSLAPIVAMWGANHYANQLPIKPGQRWLSWDKGFAEVATKSFSHGELCWTNRMGALRMLKHVWDGCFRQEEGSKVPRVHPTQKPERVMRWCMEQAGVPAGATVLDPFMGSGTTGVACMQLGHKFVGIELNEGYFDIACRRIEDAQRQGRLIG